MAQPTLLEIVQSILSSMDGDEVNAIGDTVEALQVADAVRQVYHGLVEEYDLQGEETAFKLDSVSDLDRPTHMRIPAGIFDVTMVRYDVQGHGDNTNRYKTIPFKFRHDFLDAVSNRDPDETRYTAVVDPTGIEFVVHTNGPPNFWTTVDGARHIVFDGYDSSVEARLQASKTQCLGRRKNFLSLDSDALVDIPDTLHQLLINEARELCFELYKDGAPRKLNELTRRSRARAKQRTNKIRTPADTLPDYGRKRRGG